MSAEALQFVDTNVLVYAHDVAAGRKRERAVALLEKLVTEAAGAVSIQVLQEFFVSATRKLRKPLAPEEAAAIVTDVSRWRLHSPGREDLLSAIDLHREHRLSFWDALIVTSASQLGCEVLWTEDLRAGTSYRGVTVRNPFA
jgi:predicted nucleic acid-binding protein